MKVFIFGFVLSNTACHKVLCTLYLGQIHGASSVFRLPSPVSCLPSPVSRLPSPVFRLPSSVLIKLQMLYGLSVVF